MWRRWNGWASRPTVTSVDPAQYSERTDAFDFDMTTYRRGVSLSPGNEQRLYWGCDMVETEGSRNLMGACNPAIEAMIDRMLTSESQDDYIAAVRALDRVLISERYVVPFWFNPIARIAHNAELRYPTTSRSTATGSAGSPMSGGWRSEHPHAVSRNAKPPRR
jgi:peptide/nickel transport system substrate-binding protein